MQLLLHTGWEPQDTHAHTLGRETLCLHTMQLLMYTSWWPQKTFARPFRREAFCSHNLLAAHSVTTPTQWHNTSKPQDAQCTSIRSGERHFRCEQCNYSSNRAGHLKNHKPTHTGEKFFACKQCNYTCSHSNSLMRHMLSHTGEKPFAWKHCT